MDAKIKKRCAYCDVASRLTKEHVFPDCFGRQSPDYSSRFSQPAGKLIHTDHVVKDVCAECNNKRLSPLDTYLCTLYRYTHSGFPSPGETVRFAYDPDLLLRSLLKICYNAARASKAQDVPILAGFRRWLIDPAADHPQPPQLHLQLIAPYREWRQTERGRILQEVKPKFARVGPMSLAGADFVGIHGRFVQINSYFFCLLFPGPSADRAARRRAGKALISAKPNTVIIPPSSGEVEVRVSHEDTFSVISHHLSANWKAYAPSFDPKDMSAWEDVQPIP